MTELKPCAHCGSIRVDVLRGDDLHGSGKPFWKVWCKRCQIRTAPMRARKSAVLAWNRRHVPEEES